MGQLIKTNYFWRQKDGFDKIILITKNANMEKEFLLVPKPTLEYHISNENAVPGLEYRSIPEEMTNKYKCYYKDIFNNMIENLKDPDLTDYYNGVMANPSTKGIRDKLKRIHLDYRFHGTDINIEDSYIGRYIDKNPIIENNFKLTKFFYDIEVDGSTIEGFPMAEEAACEVNIISSAIDMGEYVRVYMFCLHYTDEENPSYAEFNAHMRERVTAIKVEMEEKIKKPIKFTIKPFKNEVNLLTDFFDTINILKPDYVMGWNTSRFDFPYLYNRLGILLVGNPLDVKDIMCPKEFPYKSAQYRIDYDHVDPSDNSSSMNVASYSVHIDQENLYANLRKGKGKLESYSLDAIAELELGEHKEDLTTNIKTQHFDDYTQFFKYSVKDTLLLYMLEEKVQDIEMVNVIANVTRTRVEQCLKKTVCLRNLADKFYFDEHKIISNNRSALKTKDGKPRGAFVARLDLVEYAGMTLFNGAKPSQFLHEEVCDVDLTALYPSIIIAFNLSPETFIKKINILVKNEFTMEEENVEDVLMDEYIAGDYVYLGNKYLGLSNMDSLIDKIENNNLLV